jgi:ATP-binding protein involved in chromosome partitioning
MMFSKKDRQILLKDHVRKALSPFGDIETLLQGISLHEGLLTIVLNAETRLEPILAKIQEDITKSLQDAPDIKNIIVTMNQHQAIPADSLAIPGVKSIIAIASGKGGVGKSTTTVNLAAALTIAGQRIGILDADLYGPSLPMLMGITEKPGVSVDKKLIPIEKFGIQCFSIGFMIAPETPMIWRGPMVQGALRQMLKDVLWQDVDILLIDMPPGTGDVQLTLAQQTRMNGAIIVSTPQDIALIDARKGLEMFRKVNVPVLGIIENMSIFYCPHCGHASEIFSHGGAQREAERLQVPFLGEIPLYLPIRTGSDSGIPLVVASPQTPEAENYKAIAQKIITALTQKEGALKAPEISII